MHKIQIIWTKPINYLDMVSNIIKLNPLIIQFNPFLNTAINTFELYK